MSKDKKVEISDKAVVYLQMIQSCIDRMSTSSAIFKGFSATIMAGISAISYLEVNNIILALSFIPIIAFFLLDTYYLQLERRFIYLYNSVRTGKKELDFDLRPPTVKDILKRNKDSDVRYLCCIKSPSIFIFYFLLIAIGIIVIVLSCKGELAS